MSFVRKEEWKVVFLMRKITCLGEGNELCQKRRVESCVPDEENNLSG